MAKPRKSTQDLLLPGASGWERWTGLSGETCMQPAGALMPMPEPEFDRQAQTRMLALPVAHLWVLPAWLHGAESHLRDVAVLHLERMGVRLADPRHSLQMGTLAAREDAFLVRMVALKELPVPLAKLDRPPHTVVSSLFCLPFPADSMVIYRELGRLVLAVTHGMEVVYASVLTSRTLDVQALGEVNHLCVQLGFQGVLTHIQHLILWLDESEGDLDEVQKVTGLAALRQERPAPVMPPMSVEGLLPPELAEQRSHQAKSARTRVMLLTAGFAVAAAIAVLSVLTTWATQERDLMRQRVAELTPRASQVMDQKRAWIEAAPAVDPTTFPAQILLECMTPESAGEVAMTHFEWTPGQILLRGRTPTPSLALQYAREIADADTLSRFKWETPPPAIASDNSATFELKGGLPQ